MQKNNQYLALAIIFMLFTQPLFAETHVSLATASQNVLTPLTFFTKAVYNICYIFAIILLVSSISLFHRHRLSPNEVPLSRPIVVLLLAIVIALVPIIGQLSESSVYVS